MRHIVDYLFAFLVGSIICKVIYSVIFVEIDYFRWDRFSKQFWWNFGDWLDREYLKMLVIREFYFVIRWSSVTHLLSFWESGSQTGCEIV